MTTAHIKKDITSTEDIKLLIDPFYDSVNEDELLAPIFNQVAKVDWQHHLPTMYSFWGSLLIGGIAYNGRPFPKHLNLPINKEHFARWISLFTQTVDELFEGTKAEEAKLKAHSIARTFQMRMGLLGIMGHV
ncbi:group III truncated hemoglobin [Pontibacter korlensis]|uniref:SEC-independent protein translocase TATC n=1 Tax=Pontibacter korlensis TaxID=400092 RepID=A0A0E3ZDJ9_9BACT|nr:group III truncated hemoglobin [Pontibacter korlensis]AKD02469.1 SEC-independent protein translocase TATC [Pontibacter korlensis]